MDSESHPLGESAARLAGGVMEMTWAPDGRATFHFGTSVVEGQPHIVWRRIRTHKIFTRP
jgi:hypothetical protein